VELIILAAELVLHKRDQRDIQYIINIHHLFIMLHLIKSNITMRKQCKQQARSYLALTFGTATVTGMQFAVVVYIM